MNNFCDLNRRQPAANSTYTKVAIQWLNHPDSYRDLCIYQSFCLVASEVLRSRKLSGRHIRVAANRYASCFDDTANSKPIARNERPKTNIEICR